MNPLVISFERSQRWAAIMEKFSNITSEREIAIDDLHLVYKDNGEEMYDDVDQAKEVDIAEESDVLQDITNRTCASDDSADPQPSWRHNTSFHESLNAEDMEFLNQTRLIVDNNERLWKKAGIYKILNTFNIEKIQDKVGGWLERHNAELKQNSFIDLMPHRALNRCVGGTSNPLENNSDAESLQSADTAQYIRSNRKRQCHTFATTTTIKKFRLVQSKRDKLREKYASLVDSDDEQHCRRLLKQRRRNEGTAGKIRKTYKDVRVAARPKCLRKRRYRSEPDYTSDSSENSLFRACPAKKWLHRTRASKCCAKSATKCKQPKYHQKRNFGRCIAHSSSDLSENSTLFRLLSSNDDLRPILFESECQCRNDKQLCERNLHITDESKTDSWLVENLTLECERRAKTTKSRAEQCDVEVEHEKSKEIKPQPKSIKRRRLNRKKHEQSTPNSSLEQTANICNSTALPTNLKVAQQLKNCILADNKTGQSQVQPPTIGTEPGEHAIVSSIEGNDALPDIVLYKPGDTSGFIVQNSDGTITISRRHLSSHIGERMATKVFKHWVGAKRFNANSTVVFTPTKGAWNAESTGSDSDELESIFKYGRIFHVNN